MSKFLQAETYAATRPPVDYAHTVNPEVYYSQEYYDLEQRQVFARNWVAVAPCSAVPETGSIFIAEVAGHSLIITRDESLQLQAFHNVCRHRGTQLCAEHGKVSKYIRCPYHGWGYNLKGDCVGTPLFEGQDIDERTIKMHDMNHLKAFDKADYGLLPVRVDSWGAMIFVCLDDTAPPLQQQLGDLPQRFANYRLDEWQAIGGKEYHIAANWKLMVENAIEYYHLPWVHPRLAKTSRVIDHRRWQGDGMYCGICTTPLTQTDDSSWLDMKIIPGLSDEENISGYFFGLFPNAIMFFMPSHAFIIIDNPVAPGQCHEAAWLISHPDCYGDAGQETIDAVLTFWDEVNQEDVDICEKVQRGLQNKAYPGGRLCYRFEEPVHRFQNMVIDSMLGIRRVPKGDVPGAEPYLDYRLNDLGDPPMLPPKQYSAKGLKPSRRKEE